MAAVSAVIPGLDQGLEAYAAANRALDDAARAGHARGERWVSIAWPPWEGSGMAARHANAFRARGIEPIDADTALEVLEHAIGSGEPHVVVLDRPDVADAPLPADLDDRVRRLVGDAVALAPEQVPVDVSFPRLGLDSVAALDLVRELEHATGHHLPTTLLYEAPTVDALLRALRAGAQRSVAPAVASDALLPSQQTFAVQHAYFGDIPGNVLLACTVDPPLDRDRLRRALDVAAVRHPALCTAIAGDRQVPGPPPELRWVDAVDVGAAHAEGFDLAGPLCRVITDGRTLVLNAFHGIVDAWSLPVLVEDLLTAHQARTLPPLRASWADAAAALRAAVDRDTAWWERRYAGGVPPLPLPWRAPVDAPTAGPVRFHREVLDRSVTAGLGRRARQAGVTLPSLVLASYLACLWRWRGQHDLVVRVAQGRREVRVPDVERLVGAFADSLPVRVALHPREEVTALATRVQAELEAVQAHAASSAVALAGLARSAAGPVGLTPVGFSFPLLPAPSEVAGRTISDVHGASASGFTRLGLIAWVFDGRLHGSRNFAESHLAPDQVHAMAGEHARLLRKLATASVPVEPAAAPTLHGRILARCRRHPDRPAVGEMTYGELDRRSAGLAALLHGERIGVLARPSADAVVALLAVLRAGAAVVPLDPNWPAARLRQVLDAAAPSVVVATPDLATGDRISTDTAAEPVPDRDGPLAWVMFTSGSTGRPKGV